MNNLLINASEMVSKIHSSMTQIETCEAIAGAIAENKLVALNEKDETYIFFDEIITPEQMNELVAMAVDMINRNKEEAESFLSRLVSVEEHEEVEEGVGEIKDIDDNEKIVEELIDITPEPETVEPKKKVKSNAPEKDVYKPKKKSTVDGLNVEDIKRMYHDEARSLVEISEITGVAKSTLYSFITKNGLRKPSKKEQEFRDYKR